MHALESEGGEGGEGSESCTEGTSPGGGVFLEEVEIEMC